MDGIGFTDDEINQLNNKSPHPKRTTTKTSGQRIERTSQPSSKHVKVIGDIGKFLGIEAMLPLPILIRIFYS